MCLIQGPLTLFSSPSKEPNEVQQLLQVTSTSPCHSTTEVSTSGCLPSSQEQISDQGVTKKVSILRGSDGKIQVHGLERGQQLLRTGDGRFVVLSPRAKLKSGQPSSGKRQLDSEPLKVGSATGGQPSKPQRVAVQKPPRLSLPSKTLPTIKEHRRSVDISSNVPMTSMAAVRAAAQSVASSSSVVLCETVAKIKKPVSSLSLGHKLNQVSLTFYGDYIPHLLIKFLYLQKEKELHQICSRVILEKVELKRIIEFVLDPDVDINCTDSTGRTPLLMLCRNNASEYFYQFIESLLRWDNLNINFQDREGWNALLLVCHNSRGKQLVEVVQLLLRKGIDINATNFHGWNALHCLCRNFRGDVPSKLLSLVTLLLDEGIDLNAKAPDGSNCLNALCTNFSHRRHKDFFQVLKLLIERGAEVDAKDANGRNCLLILCAEYTGNDLIDVIRLLVEQGRIDVNACNKNGRKAVDFLLNRGFTQKSEIVQLLL